MKNRRESGIAAKSDKNSDTGQPGYLNRLRGSFSPGGSLFQHRLSGGLEPRMRFTLSGRLLSLHQLSGGRELPQASSPYPGGEFFAEPQRGVR